MDKDMPLNDMSSSPHQEDGTNVECTNYHNIGFTEM